MAGPAVGLGAEERPSPAGPLRAIRFAPYAAEAVWILIFPLTRIVFVWFFVEEHEEPG